MKQFKQIYHLIIMLLAVATISACSFIYDELEECPSGQVFSFVYDKTLSGGNAFGVQVGYISLHVFDRNGRYITTIEDDSDALNDNNYKLYTELPAGIYNFIVWGRSTNTRNSFEVSDYDSFENMYKYLPTIDGISGNSLYSQWNGNMPLQEVKNEGEEYRIALTKNTNNIRVVLQQIDGSPVDDELFDFSITDTNRAVQGATNTPFGDVKYTPFETGQSTVGGDEEGGNRITVAFAEFNTYRLMAANKSRLNITRKDDNSTVLNIPLVDYLVMRSSIYASMSDQDYLDRESNYTLILFLDRNNQWISTTIVINGWTVRINDIN